MKSIKVTILGKQIPIKVNDDEVENMNRIASFVDEKFKAYRHQLSNQPDSTVMILASLSLAEELFELRTKLEAISDQEGELMDDVNSEIEKLIKEIS